MSEKDPTDTESQGRRKQRSRVNSITSALSAEDAAEVLGKVTFNTQRVFNTTNSYTNHTKMSAVIDSGLGTSCSTKTQRTA